MQAGSNTVSWYLGYLKFLSMFINVYLLLKASKHKVV